MFRFAASGASPRRTARLAFGAVLLLTAAIRLAHLAAVADAPFVAQLALDSHEYDRWAREIVAGDWMGSQPYFQAPLYPYLLALLYSIFAASPITVYLAQIVAAVAGCAALMLTGHRLGGTRLGLVAGVLFALYLPLVFHDVLLLKESFATSAVCLLLLLLVEARQRDRWWAWGAAGVVAGVLALLRENMLLVFPILLALVVRKHDESFAEKPLRTSRLRRVALGAALLVGGFALPLIPVAVRNAALSTTVRSFLPTTSQGGVNFWIGNNPRADGTYRPLVPGKQIPSSERAEAHRLAEQASGRFLEPGEVSEYWLARSLIWARQEPVAFLRLQWKKLRLYWSFYEWPDAVDYYWMKSISPPLRLPGLEFFSVSMLALAGLFLVRRKLATWSPVLLFELGWMATTVAFFIFSRYRLPAIPGLLLLAAVPIVCAAALPVPRALAAFAAIGLVWALPVASPYTARQDLVEFNLGRLAEERGDLKGAKGHYLRALGSDPRNLSATLDLGTLAARAGDFGEARRRFTAAIEIAPDSDDAWANLGGVCLAEGDLEGAQRALNRALELNPTNRFARHNLVILKQRNSSRPDGGSG